MSEPGEDKSAEAAKEAKRKARAERVEAKARAHEAKQAKKEKRARLEAEKASANGAEAAEPQVGGGQGAPSAKPVRAKADKAAKKDATAVKAEKAKRKPPRSKRMSRRWATTKKKARGRVKWVRRRWKLTRRGVRRFYNRRWRFTYRSTIDRVPARDELPALLNKRELLGRGAEIGVKLGVYSDELLRNWHGEELVSIDPWLEAPPDEYVDRSNVSQDKQDNNYERTKEKLAPYGSRSTIWRLTSIEAAEKATDHSFDFVYIDARHDYESVLEDLEAWCTKVKPGGILAGHDYVDGDLPEGEFYVKSAVDEFFGEREIPVHGTEGPSAVEMFPTWIVEVPEEGIKPTAELESAAKSQSEPVAGGESPEQGVDAGSEAPSGSQAAEPTDERSRV